MKTLKTQIATRKRFKRMKRNGFMAKPNYGERHNFQSQPGALRRIAYPLKCVGRCAGDSRVADLDRVVFEDSSN